MNDNAATFTIVVYSWRNFFVVFVSTDFADDTDDIDISLMSDSNVSKTNNGLMNKYTEVNVIIVSNIAATT